MMFGFAEHRRQLLEAEARRFADEAPPYGAMAAWVVGEMARGQVGPETELELVIVQMTDEPFQRSMPRTRACSCPSNPSRISRRRLEARRPGR